MMVPHLSTWQLAGVAIAALGVVVWLVWTFAGKVSLPSLPLPVKPAVDERASQVLVLGALLDLKTHFVGDMEAAAAISLLAGKVFAKGGGT